MLGRRPGVFTGCYVEARGLAVMVLAAALGSCLPGQDEREVAASKLHGGPVTCVVFSPDGELLASASEDDTVRLLDISDLDLDYDRPNAVVAIPFEHPSSPFHGRGTGFRAVDFSPDGTRVAGGNYRFGPGGVIRIWDVAVGLGTVEVVGIDAPVNTLEYSPVFGGEVAVGSGWDFGPGNVALLNSLVGQQTFSFDLSLVSVRDVAFSADGELFAAASTDGAVRVWSYQDHELLCELFVEDHTAEALAFSPDGARLASAGDDSGPGFYGHAGLVRVWSLADGELDATLDLGARPLRDVAYSPDGSLLAAAGESQVVYLVRTWNSTLLETLDGHGGAINSLEFSADGELLATGADDHFVRLWYVGDLLDPADPDAGPDGGSDGGDTDTGTDTDTDTDTETGTDTGGA
ncbi:MAG: WD40 repeat domain-containing protein [Polyangia bacterium]